MAIILNKTWQYALFSENKSFSCHPEFISGSHTPLILLDAEPSSA